MKLSLFDQAIRAAVAPNARGITRTGPCKATGNDRVAQNDEPEPLTEQQLITGDRELAASKVERSDTAALSLQIAAQAREGGAL